MKETFFSATNWIIDFFFFLDILVNFRTTFIDQKTGDEVFNGKKIARNYIKSRFWIDFLATIPFDKVFGVRDLNNHQSAICQRQHFGSLTFWTAQISQSFETRKDHYIHECETRS
jgi:hypothetical protein